MQSTNIEELPHVTWKPKYILPYESIWSIRHKFCVLNAYGYTAFTKARVQYFNEKYKASTYIPVFEEAARFDKSLFSQKIRICPQCHKNAYHSRYHQLSILDYCFIHKGMKLIETSVSYTDKDHAHLYDETMAIYQKNVVNIIDNEKMRELINNSAEEINELITCLRFFDYNGTSRDRQFGNNVPFPSTKGLMRSILFNTEAENIACICDYSVDDLRLLRPFLGGKVDRATDLEYLTNNAIEEGLLSAEKSFWTKNRVEYAQALVEDFISFFSLYSSYEAKIFYGFRNVFCWEIFRDICLTDKYDNLKRSQYVALVKNNRYLIYGCRL